MDKVSLSIIICTFNRADIITECLRSVENQNKFKKDFEVIVIDNNSSDTTKSTIFKFTTKHPNFFYFFEPNQGLSYARNTGFKAAKADWVAYIDDDTRVFPDFVQRALWTIENYPFDGFGGLAIPLYSTLKTKWLPQNLEIFSMSDVSEPSLLPNDQFFYGYAMVFKKEVLIKMNGFPVDLGMSGNKIAYGEETMLQLKMRNAGFKLGYDPELKVHHLVGKHKLKLSWHIRSAYAHGRDSYGIGFSKYSRIDLIKDLAYIFLKKWPKAIAKFLLRKNYYWQNMVLDMLKPIAGCLGKYKAFRKNLS